MVYKLKFGARAVRVPESEQALTRVVVKGFGETVLRTSTLCMCSKTSVRKRLEEQGAS